MNLRFFLLTIMSTMLITSPSLAASIKSQIFNDNKSHLEPAMDWNYLLANYPSKVIIQRNLIPQLKQPEIFPNVNNPSLFGGISS